MVPPPFTKARRFTRGKGSTEGRLTVARGPCYKRLTPTVAPAAGPARRPRHGSQLHRRGRHLPQAGSLVARAEHAAADPEPRRAQGLAPAALLRRVPRPEVGPEDRSPRSTGRC